MSCQLSQSQSVRTKTLINMEETGFNALSSHAWLGYLDSGFPDLTGGLLFVPLEYLF